MAVSILVRSSIMAAIRSRMHLSAFATERISSEPLWGSGAAVPLRLKLSAAPANERRQGARRPQAKQRDAGGGKQQCPDPRSNPERTLPRIRQ
jgi:hypothetical protein